MNTIFRSSVCELTELEDLFVEMTAKNCNVRCRKCYIDFPLKKNVKDFIKIDTVKQALNDLKCVNLRCIYLTGAEPMTHPDFNAILRLCLKKTNVCIITNASFINEKKARFLKNVENESDFQILFKLSFAHYDELKNDEIRSRGSYRQNMYALKCLDKYNFTNIICVSNYYNESHNSIVSLFQKKVSDMGIENVIIQVNAWVDADSKELLSEFTCTPDCMTSRTLTMSGVYSCPFLANDYRGRTGSDFNNYSKSVRLETPYCVVCQANKDKMFSLDIDW